MLIPFGILSAAAGKAIRVAVAGYFGGGFIPGTAYATVDKLLFPAETVSALGTGLSAATGNIAAFADSGVAGYYALDSGTVNKFAFPSDSRTSLGTGLSINRNNTAGFANSAVAGYVTGGLSSVAESRIDKFAFPSDTRSTLNLPSARWTHGAMANTGVAGYTGGGFSDNVASVPTDTVFKVAFPSDTTSTLGTGLSSTRYGITGINDAGVAGYFCAGVTSAVLVATVDKFTFATDTRSSGPSLSLSKVYVGGAQSSGVAGYIGGGDTGSRIATIDKIAFPGDTRTTLASTLTQARSAVTGMSNEGVF